MSEPIFSFDQTGKVTIGDGFTADDASRAFWENLGTLNPLHTALAAERERADRLESVLREVLPVLEEEYSGVSNATLAKVRALAARQTQEGK